MNDSSNHPDLWGNQELRPRSSLSGAGTAGEQSDAPSTRHATLRTRPKTEGSLWGALFWIVCCVAFVVGLWQIGPQVAERYQYFMSRGKMRAEFEHASKVLGDNPLANLSLASQMVAMKIRPSVVSIECRRQVDVGVGGRQLIGMGQGSGVIVSDDGYIVTNFHVIEQSLDSPLKNPITVRLADKFLYPAQVVGTDYRSDLAVLKIDARNLIPATWGDSENLEVGSMVWAVGSPFGMDQTVTSGIISAKNRTTEVSNSPIPNRDLLQTDAAVNPGNSGGPLVDSQGRVVGINTSIVGDTYQGISFAVPSAAAKFVAEQIISNGQVRRGFFGFEPAEVTQEIYDRLGLPDMQGALVRSVRAGTPARRAGLQTDDVIRSWNGKPIESYIQVYNYIAVTPVDADVDIEVFRNGSTLKMTVGVTAIVY